MQSRHDRAAEIEPTPLCTLPIDQVPLWYYYKTFDWAAIWKLLHCICKCTKHSKNKIKIKDFLIRLLLTNIFVVALKQRWSIRTSLWHVIKGLLVMWVIVPNFYFPFFFFVFFRFPHNSFILQVHWRFVHLGTSCHGNMGVLFCSG